MTLKDLFARWEYRHRHSEQTCGPSKGVEGGVNWETNVETYPPPHVRQRARGKLPCA